MRQPIVVFGTVGTLLLTMAPAAEARHRSLHYCSESGDLCQSTRKVDGVRKLRITMTEKYFRRFRLCVDPPGDAPPACFGFRVRKQSAGYTRSVRWRKHFPDFGAGAYAVTWRRRGSRVGPRLRFHV